MARTVMTPGWTLWLRDQVAWPTLASVTSDVARDANRRAPRFSGDLAGSYIWRRVSRLKTRVGSHLEYGTYVELGTRPHEIRVRNKKVLYNNLTGQFFGARVHHPGTRAQPHLRPSLYTKRKLKMVTFR